MPPKKTALKDVAFQTLLIAFVGLLLVLFFHSSLRYPYYFIYDMDQVSTVDTILINSGSLPDHINHPGFGMYLLLSASSCIARALDVVSIGTLSDMQDSLNPIVGVAELTEYLRLHTPIFVVCLVLTLWTSLRLLFPLSRSATLLALLLLGFQESLFYHASLIRTDFYSVMYFSAAVLFLVLGARSARAGRSFLWVFLAGVLLGLAFLTKIQSLFLVAAAPFFLLLARAILSPVPPSISPTFRAKMTAFLAILFSLLVFATLMVLAARTSIPPGYATYTEKYGITLLAVVALAALVVLFLLQVGFFFRKAIHPDWFALTSLATFLATGFVFSFFLHLVLFADLRTGMEYLLYDFKVSFLRPNPYALSLAVVIDAVHRLIVYCPWLFSVHLILLGMLVLGRSAGIIRISTRILLLCATLTGFALLHLFLSTRFILRDLLWIEVFFNFLTLVFAGIALTHSARHRWLVRLLVYGCLASLLAVNILHTRYIGRRSDANYNAMGWNRSRWFDSLFLANQRKYTRVLRSKYAGESWKIARENSDRFADDRRVANFVFQNQIITQRNIGFVAEGYQVSLAFPQYRIESYTPVLKNGIVIDSASVPRQTEVSCWPELVRQHTEMLDKFRPLKSPDRVCVLPRRDLKIYLFASDEDLTRIGLPKGRGGRPVSMTLQGANGPVELQGEPLTYSELPVTSFTGVYYFVIVRTGT